MTYKEQKRERRIRDRERIKKKTRNQAKEIFRFGYTDDDWDKTREAIENYVRYNHKTRKKCSCYMCGNPRIHWNELTIQEQKNHITSIKEWEAE